ncbi:TadE/TadG family type IV pilus assembly protein [uncultured Hyphomicrobium sp.]|uniref:TadE/TadG family type IV pilus assembly protein n=1 Tax=uncultured Hyphomicrobium sp. TaxID=194373 RepID=UPI0025F7DA82|nr:TadE/TadG family type IV pilus assembly protein [uncultured Hyphomicrobium sp.]
MMTRTSRLAAAIRSFVRDIGGVAAVEFGFIAPVLLVMLLGAIEVTRAMSINTRISLATSMVADLVAREQQLTGDDVRAIYEIANEIMAPYDGSKLDLSLIPIMSASNNASRTLVYPSVTNRPPHNHGTVPAKCQAYSLASGMLKTNESVIVVEARYMFEPLFGSYILNAGPWTKKAYAKPRKSLCVAFDGATCTSSCFSS